MDLIPRCKLVGFNNYVELLKTGFETVDLIDGVSKPWSLNQELDHTFLIEAVTTPNTVGYSVACWRIQELFAAGGRMVYRAKMPLKEAHFLLTSVLSDAKSQLTPVFYEHAFASRCKISACGASLTQPVSPMANPGFESSFGLDHLSACKIMAQRKVKIDQCTRFQPPFVTSEEGYAIMKQYIKHCAMEKFHHRRKARGLGFGLIKRF